MPLANLNQKLGAGTKISLLIFLYLSLAFGFTLTPFTFSPDPSQSFSSLYSERFENLSGLPGTNAWSIFSNFLLFIPFGFLFGVLPFVSEHGTATKIALASICTCLLSLSIELCQLFLPRAPSMVDILFNTLGGATGTVLAIYYDSPLCRVTHQWWARVQAYPYLRIIAILYLLLLFGLSIFPIIDKHLSDWDPQFPFQLGNEATLDRPWLGRIYLVSIHERALLPREIATRFIAGIFSDPATTQGQDELVAVYRFDEGSGSIVHDRSSNRPNLDLWIRDAKQVQWLSPNGIELMGATIISSIEPPEKLFMSESLSHGGLTIEIWFAPATVNQTGPARIVSYSQDPYRRNFTLGQDGPNIIFRLRTPVTGLNGRHPELKTTDDPLTAELQHVVVTYLNGVETMYLNGKEHKRIFLGGKSYLDAILIQQGKWSYWAILTFPVGFFSYILYQRRQRYKEQAVVLSTLTGLITLVVVEGLHIIFLHRQMDLSVISVGMAVIFVSIITSATFITSHPKTNR